MGAGFALDLADIAPVQQGIRIHLTSNFYPPIPVEMVKPCIKAIDACNDGDDEVLIQLPEVNGFQIRWRGEDTAPAWAIVEQHRLWPWIDGEEG